MTPARQPAAPDPFLLWEGTPGKHAGWIVAICKCIEYWSPRGRTCIVELDSLTSPRAHRSYGDAILAGIDQLVKRKIVTYEAGVVTIPKIFKPELQGKLARNRAPE